MTLAEFRELTKDLPGELELVLSVGDDDGNIVESVSIDALLGLDLVESREYDFIELFSHTQEA